ADLARQVHREHNSKPLTDNQLAAAQRVLAQLGEQKAREARRAEEKANTPPSPSGKAIPVAGEIVKIKAREGYMNGTVQLQAVVRAADGYAVQVTLPRVVEDWARSNRSEKIWPRTTRPHYGATDYEGIGIRWTDALKGSRLAFTAGELNPW